MRAFSVGFLSAMAVNFAAVGAAPGQTGPEPTLLWQFAQDCLWAQQNGQKPDCESVGKDANGAFAYVIKRDVQGDWQFLLIPTAAVTGIESPDLERDGAPNYFAYAWEATALVSQHRQVAVARQDLALAVNSAIGRSMHQLHIHIDCIRLDVRQALHAHDGEVTTHWLSIADAKWPEFATVFGRHHYLVRWVDGPTLHGVNVFRLVAERDADTGGDMALQTIVVVGGPERHHLAGFYVLTDKAHIHVDRNDPIDNDSGSGEDLMEHQSCPALKVAP
jgi:CDP-diacylglycerol pyrophosphatase